MANYGIKVSQSGFDVSSATPRQLVYSSKYATLKVKKQGSGTITDSGGRTITIAHGLGYVPVFLVHVTGDINADSSDYYITPYHTATVGRSIVRDVTCYADSTNLYIVTGDDFGYWYSGTGQLTNNYANRESDGTGDDLGWCEVGEHDGTEDGALRFIGVSIAQGTTIRKAELGYYVRFSFGDEPAKLIIYGIDEDNTALFNSGTYPMDRDKTSANSGAIDINTNTEGTVVVRDVTSMAQEIINRGSWSSGNAMGFILEDNSSPDECSVYVQAVDDGFIGISKTFLRILGSNTLLSYKYTIFYEKGGI